MRVGGLMEGVLRKGGAYEINLSSAGRSQESTSLR